MNRTEFHTKANNYLCILIAFFLPVYIFVVPALIIFLLLNWIAEGGFAEKFKLLTQSRIALLFILFYFLHLIGMLWTENKPSGYFDLEVKLSLLLFPIILSTGKSDIKKILWSLVWGCLTASLICLIVASAHYLKTGENHFEYTLLSIWLHPAYLAMYIVFSIAIILFSFNTQFSTLKKTGFLFLILLLSGFTILLSSKIGTISLILLLLSFVIHHIIIHKAWVSGLLFFTGILVLIFSIFHFLPYTKNRIINSVYWIQHINEIDIEHTESDAARILVWQSDISLIKENYLYGVGTGDIKDELIKKYIASDYKEILERKLNAHNQFFQTTIGLGVVGGLVLVSLFISGIYNAIKGKKKIFLAFLIILLLNFLVESMLEVQAGVMFYAFFNSLLLFSQKEQ